MAPRRACVSRCMNENMEQEAHPQAPQVPVCPMVMQVTNVKFRVALKVLAESNRKFLVLVNYNMGTTSSRVRKFTRIKPPQFCGSKV